MANRYVLDASKFSTPAGFYDEAVAAFALFPEFGRNLDALADALADNSGLSNVSPGDEIVWIRDPEDRLDADFREAVEEVLESVPEIRFSRQ